MRASAEPKVAGRSRFLLRKLHSLSGVAPVGVFLLFHLWTNARALNGRASFDEGVSEIQKMPYLPALELGLVLAPLLFHAIYGVKLALEGRPNASVYSGSRNWMYSAQRLTGLAAFAFVIWHLTEYWLPKWAGQMTPDRFYPALCEDLSRTNYGVPVVALLYVFGIAASVFHFANGLWGFCCSWGITVSQRSQRVSAIAFGVLGILVFLLGANTAIYFATGSRLAILGVPRGTKVAELVRTCGDPAPLPGRVVVPTPNGPARLPSGGSHVQ